MQPSVHDTVRKEETKKGKSIRLAKIKNDQQAYDPRSMGVRPAEKKERTARARTAQKGSGCNGPLFVLDINVPRG